MRTLLIALTAALLLAACADELPSAPSQPPPADLSEIEQAAAKLREWLDTVPSVQLEISAVSDGGQRRWYGREITELTATAMITDDRFYIAVYRPLRDLPDQPPLRTETLVVADRRYYRPHGVNAWLSRPLTQAQRSASSVVTPAGVATIAWAQLPNVSLTRIRDAGRAVWLIEYEVKGELADQRPDLASPIAARIFAELPVDIESPHITTLLTSVRLWLDSDSGAPLRTETLRQFNEDGRIIEVSTTISLTAWGSLLKLPRPEPLALVQDYWELTQAALPPVVRYRSTDTGAINRLRRTREEWFVDGRTETIVQQAAVTLHGERRTLSREAEINADVDQLPLSLAQIYPFFELTQVTMNEYGEFESLLELRMEGEALEALQELAVSVVQSQLGELLNSPPAVLSVERLDAAARLGYSGVVFGGMLSADATTADGPLELEIDLRVTSIDRDDLN